MAGNKMNTQTVPSPVISINRIHSDAPELGPLLDIHPNLLVYTKSNTHFDEIRTLFNHEITTTPRAIIRPPNENELTSSVSFCAEHKLPMSVRSGGHDVHGRSLIQDGVVIDVRALTKERIVHEDTPPYVVVGPGVKSGDLLHILDHHGLVTPIGWCSEVGYTGWASGGGYGVKAGYYGLGADQILGARVATPAGAIVDTDDDPELPWALRGAGLGNFGLILELRCRVYPRPRVLAGVLAYPCAEVRSVLGNVERMCAQDLTRAFPGEVAMKDSGFGPAILIYFHWVLDDNDEEGRAYLRKMGDLGNLVSDTVNERESRS